MSVAAAILADEQKMTVDELVTVLRESSPLEELQYGTTPGVRAAFDLSYARLTDEERRVFLSFALHIVSWHTVESAATTNALPLPVARRVLRSLRRAHLVELGHRDGWFRLHDLLSRCAQSLVEWSPEATDEMRQRFCDYLIAGLSHASTWHQKERLDKHNLSHTFAGLLDAAAIATPEGRRRPRLHDLRHSFATATLLDWYRDGEDVAARLPQRS